MHLGNIYAALLSYLSAKAKGGSWILRIEDTDPQRSRREWALRIMDDLVWLGLRWDEGPFYQSERGTYYTAALCRLASLGVLYPCHCTRAAVLATQAPHESDGHVVYGGHCRPASLLPSSTPPEGETLRLMTPPLSGTVMDGADNSVCFRDTLLGGRQVTLSTQVGDFVVRRRDGAWAYQLACAVDDALMGVTEVVRGRDLLLSTAAQRYLQSLLGLEKPQSYTHLPLLLDENGARLSKRDGSLSMEWLRANSSPADVVARLCRLAGVDPEWALSLTDL